MGSTTRSAVDTAADHLIEVATVRADRRIDSGVATSLTAAQARARALLADGAVDVEVVVAAGVYEMSEPLTLSAADSPPVGGRVCYRAAPGAAPVISGEETLLSFADAHDIEICGLTFERCIAGPERSEDRPTAAVTAVGSQRITLSHNTVRFVGGAGIDFVDDVQDCRVVGNLMHDVAGDGIVIGALTREDSSRAAERSPRGRTCARIDVVDNMISRVGGAAVRVGHASSCSVEHNDMSDVGSAVALGWPGGWGRGSRRAVARDHIVRYNRVNGAVDAGVRVVGNLPGLAIAGNHLVNTLGSAAIVLDRGASGVLVAGNVVEGPVPRVVLRQAGPVTVLDDELLSEAVVGCAGVRTPDDGAAL
jgi:hypothetical protein